MYQSICWTYCRYILGSYDSDTFEFESNSNWRSRRRDFNFSFYLFLVRSTQTYRVDRFFISNGTYTAAVHSIKLLIWLLVLFLSIDWIFIRCRSSICSNINRDACAGVSSLGLCVWIRHTFDDQNVEISIGFLCVLFHRLLRFDCRRRFHSWFLSLLFQSKSKLIAWAALRELHIDINKTSLSALICTHVSDYGLSCIEFGTEWNELRCTDTEIHTKWLNLDAQRNSQPFGIKTNKSAQ